MLRKGSGSRVPEYTSFIRSIRIRYLSGLLIFALATAAVIFALGRVNSLRHDVDILASDLTAFTRDLRNATNFAEAASTAWRPETREALARAARNHSEPPKDHGLDVTGVASSRTGGVGSMKATTPPARAKTML